MIPIEWFVLARERIQPHVIATPLTYDPYLDIFIKWENRQLTGSFKVRGAINKILSLEPWERERPLVAASAGNHGQGVAVAANLVGTQVEIFVSENAMQSKILAMRQLGAQIHLVAGGYGEAEQAALDYVKKTEKVWISPYNDGQIIAGQGTIALEILEQNPELGQAAWIVPIGGGGLLSGIGSVLSELVKNYRLIGVQSQASAYFHQIFYTRTQAGVIETPSVADGLAGPVEKNSLTIPIVCSTVQEIQLVSEPDISTAISYAWHTYQQIIEGSAAVSLALVMAGKIKHRPLVVILSGGNIPANLHNNIIRKETKLD